MSDSEDEAAFASADEGEVTDKSSPKKKQGSKDSAAAIAAETKTTEIAKKDTASGQSKNQKKKGKKGKKNEPQKSEAAKPPKKEVKEDVKPKEANKTDKENVDTSKEKDVKDKTEEKQKSSVEDSSEKTNIKKETLIKDGKQEVKTDISKDEKPKPEEPKETVKTDSTPKEDLKSTPEKSSTPPQVESPSTQSIPRSAAQGEATGVEDNVEAQEKSGGGWGWGSWGSSLLTAASSSVSTFTSQVGEGFTTIVDSVESSLGAPPPEEIARLEAEQEEEEEEQEMEKTEEKKEEGKPSEAEESSPGEEKAWGGADGGGGGGWFSSLGVSSLTSKIQNTGKSLVSGSLDAVEALATGSIDVLENIGKKTINVLSDHDPGFKKTRSTLFEHGEKKQNLSTLLREAKEQAEKDAAVREEQEEARKHNYGAVFDDFQGLAHLEALEILSNQSEKKVQALLTSLPADAISTLKPQLLQIKELFELDDSDYEDRKEHDFSKLITDLLSELHLGTTPDKLNKVQEKNRQWIINFYAEPAEGEEKPKVEPKEIFHAAISALAELTAKSVEQFHKAGELILLQKDSDTSFEKRSKSLSCLTQVLCTEVSILSTKFTQCLHKVGEDIEDSSVITPLVTNVYLEASNSSTYIQDGFQLLLPVLQQAAIQNSPLLES